MNIVYLIEVNRDKLPNKYIGSKSGCSVINGKIMKQGKEYIGSSTDPEYKKAVNKYGYNLTILHELDEYDKTLLCERDEQMSRDVVADPAYFNKAIAAKSNYADPSYATYKHTVTGKRARLPRNHSKVISGEWVGVTKGRKLPDEERNRRSAANKGSRNPFYGRHHNEESKRIISIKHTGHSVSPERRRWFIENVAKPKKSKSHRRKIGRPGLVMLENIATGECVRVTREKARAYDRNEWKNPFALSVERKKKNGTFVGRPHSEATKKKIGRKGYTHIKNKDTGECLRVLCSERHKYDRNVWKHPKTIIKEKREGK